MNHGDDFDDRNRCMRAFIQLIAEAKPMYFVMEQVTEILTEEDKDKPGRFLIDSVRRDAFEGKISMVLYPHNIHTHTHCILNIRTISGLTVFCPRPPHLHAHRRGA